MLLQLEPGMIVWTWITFIVLIVILYKIAWNPLVKLIEEREAAIEENLHNAQKEREEAEAMLNEQRANMAKTHQEVKAILENTRQLAEKTKREIIEQAKADAEKLIQRSKADIERERLEAISSLKKEVGSMVIRATSRIIGVSLDEKKHRDLIEKSIKELGNN